MCVSALHQFSLPTGDVFFKLKERKQRIRQCMYIDTKFLIEMHRKFNFVCKQDVINITVTVIDNIVQSKCAE